MNGHLHIREIARQADESLKRSQRRRRDTERRRTNTALLSGVVFVVVIVAFATFLLVLFPR